MTPEKEKKLKELSAERKQHEKKQAEVEEECRQAGSPGCLGTLESLTAYHNKINEIDEEIQKLNE